MAKKKKKKKKQQNKRTTHLRFSQRDAFCLRLAELAHELRDKAREHLFFGNDANDNVQVAEPFLHSGHRALGLCGTSLGNRLFRTVAGHGGCVKRCGRHGEGGEERRDFGGGYEKRRSRNRHVITGGGDGGTSRNGGAIGESGSRGEFGDAGGGGGSVGRRRRGRGWRGGVCERVRGRVRVRVCERERVRVRVRVRGQVRGGEGETGGFERWRSGLDFILIVGRRAVGRTTGRQ